MHIVLVSDVFGRTPSLIHLGESIGAHLIIDPYNGGDMRFKNESEAYTYFSNHVGLESYIYSLKLSIEKEKSPIVLVGFSVGASAVWALSGLRFENYICSGVCYYGSQIRNLLDVEPTFPIKAIFPESESHFDVSNLLMALTHKKNTQASQVDFLHGFMNKHSKNFNEIAYATELKSLSLM